MKLEFVETYRGVNIKRNVYTGSYYIKSPWNNTTRMFKRMETVRNYIDDYAAIDSHAEAMKRNPM